MPTYVPGLYENKAEVLQRFRYILAMQNHSANLHVRFSGNTIALVAPDGARGDVISSGQFVLGPLITMAQPAGSDVASTPPPLSTTRERPPASRRARRAPVFRQSDVSRAVKAAQAAGLHVSKIEIDIAGKILIGCGAQQESPAQDAYAAWKGGRIASAAQRH